MIRKKLNKHILNGALTHHKNFLAGFYKGYYITIDDKSPVCIVYIHATFDTLSGKALFETFLKEYQKSMLHLVKFELTSHSINLRILQPKSKEDLLFIFNETIETIIEQLLKHKYVTGCIDCGDNDGKIDCYEIVGCHQYICEECIARIKENFKIIKANPKYTSVFKKKPNYSIKKMNLQ